MTAPSFMIRGDPAYRRVNVALVLSGFATFSLLYSVQPLLPIFAQDFAVDAAESSLALSLTTGCLAFAILGAAALSEIVGRRSLIFASLAAASILNIAAAFSPNWRPLLVMRGLEGLALGGVPAVAMAYLAEEVDPRALGFAMGLYIAGNAFGGMVGRVGAGIIAENFSWRAALAVIGLIGLACAIGFLRLLPPSRNFVRQPGFDPRYHLNAWSRHLRAQALRRLFAIGFLIMGAFVTIYNYAGFRLIAPPYSLSQTELGLIFTVYLFGIAASSAAGALSDRIGRPLVLMAGILVAASGVGVTLLPGLAGMVVGIVLLTIGFFMTHSVASGAVGRLAAESKGHASSLYLLAYYVGSSILGSAGGWFLTKGGWTAVAAFTLAILALAFLAALDFRRLAAQRTR
jgi:YNFM family putative membrane transporter